MATEVFNRYEHKYLIDNFTYEKVIKVMDEHMELDSHSKNHEPYTISNIYFDTDDNYLIRTSLSKPEYKEKLRLRAYGAADKNSMVFLEIKKKYKGIVNKRRTVLKLSEAYDFISIGKEPTPSDYINKQVLKEISYFLQVYNPKPKLFLAYDRIAYFEKNNRDLRVSFDMNIRSRRFNLKFEDGDYGEKLLDENMYLMEVKTGLAKPLWLTHMLTELNIKRTSFSKYGTEFKNSRNNSLQIKTAV